MQINIVKANYSNPKHQIDILLLLESYAMDPMGGGKPLDKIVKDNLITELARREYAFSLIAYVDHKPAGLANCFEAFSTFSCKPLINIHDMVVIKTFRGLGIAQKIMTAIEKIAQSKGCCKITLEVLSNNKAAKAAYRNFGFDDYKLDPKKGTALFWQKVL